MADPHVRAAPHALRYRGLGPLSCHQPAIRRAYRRASSTRRDRLATRLQPMARPRPASPGPTRSMHRTVPPHSVSAAGGVRRPAHGRRSSFLAHTFGLGWISHQCLRRQLSTNPGWPAHTASLGCPSAGYRSSSHRNTRPQPCLAHTAKPTRDGALRRTSRLHQSPRTQGRRHSGVAGAPPGPARPIGVPARLPTTGTRHLRLRHHSPRSSAASPRSTTSGVSAVGNRSTTSRTTCRSPR